MSANLRQDKQGNENGNGNQGGQGASGAPNNNSTGTGSGQGGGDGGQGQGQGDKGKDGDKGASNGGAVVGMTQEQVDAYMAKRDNDYAVSLGYEDAAAMKADQKKKRDAELEKQREAERLAAEKRAKDATALTEEEQATLEQARKLGTGGKALAEKLGDQYAAQRKREAEYDKRFAEYDDRFKTLDEQGKARDERRERDNRQAREDKISAMKPANEQAQRLVLRELDDHRSTMEGEKLELFDRLGVDKWLADFRKDNAFMFADPGAQAGAGAGNRSGANATLRPNNPNQGGNGQNANTQDDADNEWNTTDPAKITELMARDGIKF